MSDDGLHTYLRDHLAGAAFGTDLAKHLGREDDIRPAMASLSSDIEADRRTLLEVIDAVGAQRNSVKEAVSWVGEKAGRLKFSGITGTDPQLGTLMALESLSLGIQGKRKLWVALHQLGDRRLERFDFSELIERAERQHDTVENLRQERLLRALT